MGSLDALLLKQKSSKYSSYVYIAFTVILFNLIAVFGLGILLHDDPAWYRAVLSGEFPSWMLRYNLLSPFTEWIGWNIMAYSPKLARGLYVLLLMVPLSCCFYYLYEHKFGFSRMTAFTAAVIPNILPMQWQIPTGINPSYVLWGLLVSVVSLILGFSYLEKSTPRNWIRLTGAVLCYGAATQIMEQALFLFPPLILAFWGYKKFDKKNIRLVSLFTLVALSRLIHMALLPRVPIKEIAFDEILRRVLSLLKWSLPFGDIDSVYLVVIFLGVISAGFVFSLKKNEVEHKFNRIFLYFLFFCWAISTVFVFIVMSRHYSPRYVFISSFGLNAVFILSLDIIFKNVFHLKFKLHILVFAAIIIFSGTSRYFTLKATFAPLNLDFSIVQRDLNKIQLPPDSQIVIIGIYRVGGWQRSSGYLQFALKRADVTGLIGPVNRFGYYNFDDHFDTTKRGWNSRVTMSGLTLENPLFLFYCDPKSRKLIQMEYALQWRGEKKDAPWTIFRVDKRTGEIIPFNSGVGMEEYLTAIEKLELSGIRQSEILWGGPSSEKERERLEGGLPTQNRTGE